MNSDTEALELNDRVLAVNKVLPFAEKSMDSLSMNELYEKEDQLKSAIVFARGMIITHI